jgi:membrane-associated protein
VVCLIVGTVIGIRQYRQEMSQPIEDFDLDPASADADTMPLPGLGRAGGHPGHGHDRRELQMYR